MDKNAIWKWLILILVTCWSVVVVTPLRDKIKLGLDLRGGTSFVLEVDTTNLDANAIKDSQARALEVIRNRVDSMGVSEPIIYPEPNNNRIVVQIPGLKTEDRERAIKNIQSAAFLEFRMVHPKNDELIDALFEKGLAPAGYKIVPLDEQGYNGQYRTVYYYKREKGEGDAALTDQEVRARLKAFQPVSGYEILLMKVTKQNTDLFLPYYVNRLHELTGDELKSAGVDYQNFGQPIVTLRFDSRGARRFARLTSDYAPGGANNPDPNGRRYLAIVLDGKLYSAPFIKTAIIGGNAIIEGSFSLREAQDLAIVLRAGSLPAPVKVIEERTVDPSLGRDSIESGKRAAVIGGVAVVAFMAVYYMMAGLVANLALLLNLVLLPLGMLAVSGFFSLLDSSGMVARGLSLPTLTLPGIAGIVLTAGMAVDANVLIFERMREEQRQGKRFAAVVVAGYDKAFSAIFDSNITTVLAAVIMFWLGSGPVRGYAVTLTAGILVSMYTAIVVTRMIFDLLVRYTNVSKIRMMQWIGETNIDFIGKRFIAIGLSVVVIGGSMAAFFIKGKGNFGVDFTGGATVTFSYTEKQSTEKVRDALSSAGVREATIQYQKENIADVSAEAREYLEIKVPFEDGERAVAAITATVPGYQVVKQDSVGPQVGNELQKKGLLAVGISLLGMIIYISWRFEFAFAMGAVVALIHDVLACIGIFCLLGRQLNMTTIAAVLTIIGYSVNDTIVIFDRIREDMKLYRGRSFKDIANLSINQTLGRTILTSFTSMITVVALLVFGGGAIFDFALALFVGMVSGVYSTVYVATPVVMFWHNEKKV
ncbi:MAG TPA: protein translocase subunit SecD [Kiritimatiellia bacterium]|nr:protein translocase subunit SecD [Kiritimatiellia bacterium]